MDRAISVGDFETPLDAVKTGLDRGAFAVAGEIALHKSHQVGFHRPDFATHLGHLAMHCADLAAKRLQLFKDQFVCDVLAHGLTIAVMQK